MTTQPHTSNPTTEAVTAHESTPTPITNSPPAYVPYIPEPATPKAYQLSTLTLGDPIRWLRQGLLDLRIHPLTSLWFGCCFWVMYMVLRWVFQHNPEYTISLASGCLLVGPAMCMGLYDISRRQSQGLPPSFYHSTTCWTPHLKSLSMLILVLIVLELLWGRASLVVFAVFFDSAMPTTQGVLKALLSPENLQFLITYAAVGGVFAFLVYTFSVVAIPMILDRDTDAITASLTSFKVVFNQPHIMLWWGFLITCLIIAALLPWGLGLILVGPIVGHASWHAYRACVHWLDPIQKTTNAADETSTTKTVP